MLLVDSPFVLNPPYIICDNFEIPIRFKLGLLFLDSARNDIMLSTFAWAVYRGQTHGSAPTTKALKILYIKIAKASCLVAACGQARCHAIGGYASGMA